MDKDIIILLAVVILVALVIIIINIPKNNAKKNPVRFYKNNFFMLKDKVNNIYVYVYVYVYEHRTNDNYNDLYLSRNDVYFSSERIAVKNYYDKDNPILTTKHSSYSNRSYGY